MTASKAQGRHTQQGSAVLEALRSGEGFRSAQEIHRLISESGLTIGLATVYRRLQSLAEEGLVDALPSPQGVVLYRECSSPGHHHHLICKSCGTAVEVEVPGLEEWSAQTAEAEGFVDITHTVEIFGVCTNCQTKFSQS